MAVADWLLLRAAWLAEDAGPRFALGMLVLLVALVRVGVAALAGWLSRNVGLGVGIASTVTTFFVWRQVIGTLPGTAVVDDVEHTFAIPEWSFGLVLTWTVALIGFWAALLWPGQRWPTRLRNAAPFLVGAAALLLAFRPFG